jgi:hypothetical protein
VYVNVYVTRVCTYSLIALLTARTERIIHKKALMDPISRVSVSVTVSLSVVWVRADMCVCVCACVCVGGSKIDQFRTLKDFANTTIRLLDRTSMYTHTPHLTQWTPIPIHICETHVCDVCVGLRVYLVLLKKEVSLVEVALATLNANEGALAPQFAGASAGGSAGMAGKPCGVACLA